MLRNACTALEQSDINVTDSKAPRASTSMGNPTTPSLNASSMAVTLAQCSVGSAEQKRRVAAREHATSAAIADKLLELQQVETTEEDNACAATATRIDIPTRRFEHAQ